MKGRFIASLALGVLVAAMLPGVAGATQVDGRPGQIAMREITIDAFAGNCHASYDVIVNGNIVIVGASGFDDIHVVVTKKHANATCHFTDISGVFEANAEVGIGPCTIVDADGNVYEGDGRVTAAENGDRDTVGGNTSIHCQGTLV